MNIEHLCKGCMRQMDTSGGICPRCGYDNEKPENRSIKCLPEYTILNGRYMIGRVLGEGGFGITYLALDLISETPVAVKEYFPAGLAARDSADGSGKTLIMLDGERERYFQDGLQKFALEGRNLAKLSRQPGIVTALDFFEANGTAYLVMEYIEGQSLKQYMQWYRQNSNNKPIDYPVAIAFLEPVMKALIEVHRIGLIHRDISPDNILVDKDGKVTLIDFGSARIGVKENELRSMTIMVKHGYAPQEQYRTHGKQGPWTDVYALCATLYHMISGELPVDSIERMHKDELIPLKNLDLPVPVPAAISDILEKGMNVWPDDRYQTMEDFYHDLKNAQEELDAREKALERERLEQARLEAEQLESARIEAEQLERERLEKARLEAARLEQERQQMEQEGFANIQTQSGNIQTVSGKPTEKFQQQKEVLKEKENALIKQEKALKEQERLRSAEHKRMNELLQKEKQRRARQKKMLLCIEAVAAVVLLAAGISVFSMNSGKQKETLPATAQVQITETEHMTTAETKSMTTTETGHMTEQESIVMKKFESTAVDEIESAVATETASEKLSEKETMAASEVAEKLYNGKFTIDIFQFSNPCSLLDNCREGFLEGLAEEGIIEDKNLTVDISWNYTENDNIDLSCLIFDRGDSKLLYRSCITYELTLPEIVIDFSERTTAEKQLEMIRKILPAAERIGILYTIGDINFKNSIEEYKVAAEEYGFEIVDIGINTDKAIEMATGDMISKVDCISNLIDNTVNSELQTILTVANEVNIPVFGSNIEQVKNGCLAFAGIDHFELGKQTGKMAASILKGEVSASTTIPDDIHENASLYINTEVAEKLGIEIDEYYLAQAAEVFDTIEKEPAEELREKAKEEISEIVAETETVATEKKSTSKPNLIEHITPKF